MGTATSAASAGGSRQGQRELQSGVTLLWRSIRQIIQPIAGAGLRPHRDKQRRRAAKIDRRDGVLPETPVACRQRLGID